MKTLGNILWLVLGGLFMAVGYALWALLLFCLIVTIPFAKQMLKLAGYTLWPFGRTVVKGDGGGSVSALGNILWFIPGLIMAAGHVLAALANLAACVFLITIPICLPFALAHLKLAGLALMPFNREVVDEKDAHRRALVTVRDVRA